MWPRRVVVVEPVWQGGGSVAVVAVDEPVGPLARHRLVESFDLPVGARPLERPSASCGDLVLSENDAAVATVGVTLPHLLLCLMYLPRATLRYRCRPETWLRLCTDRGRDESDTGGKLVQAQTLKGLKRRPRERATSGSGSRGRASVRIWHGKLVFRY